MKSLAQPSEPTKERRKIVNTGKKGTPKKKGTLRPWLVDVIIDHLR
jgi:hypothetical protein